MPQTSAGIAKLASLCEHSLRILNRYYNFHALPQLAPFIFESAQASISQRSGQVLFQEDAENLFIGIQFGTELIQAVCAQGSLFSHDVAVIAEESSHFKFLLDTIEHNSQTTQLEIETLGEIDRFLCLLHWNATSMLPAVEAPWQNLSQLCDFVFSGPRFQKTDCELYIKAEGLAFKHLKTAFAQQWYDTHFNFHHVHAPARAYLTHMRTRFMTSYG